MRANACAIGPCKGGPEEDSDEALCAAVAVTAKTADPAPWQVIKAVSVTGDDAMAQAEDLCMGERTRDTLTPLLHDVQQVIVSKPLFARP